MWPFDPPANRTPSSPWLWGFWVYTAAAVAIFVISLYGPTPLERLLRGIAGTLFFAGGPHQLRVVNYRRVTRGPYSTYGPYSCLLQRQTGWSAMVFGVVLIASAVVGL